MATFENAPPSREALEQSQEAARRRTSGDTTTTTTTSRSRRSSGGSSSRVSNPFLEAAEEMTAQSVIEPTPTTRVSRVQTVNPFFSSTAKH